MIAREINFVCVGCVIEEQVIADLKDFSNNFKVSQLSTSSVLLFYIDVMCSRCVLDISNIVEIIAISLGMHQI